MRVSGLPLSGSRVGRRRCFYPRDIPNCVLWLRADLGIVLNGSSVSQWSDYSGQGNHVTQSNASLQPAYVSSAAGGRPAVRFTRASTQKLVAASSSILNFERTQALTIFVVSVASGTPSDDSIVQKGNPIANGWGVHSVSTDNIRFAEANSGTNRLVTDITTSTSVSSVKTIQYTGSSAAAGVSARVNGSAQTVTATVDALSASILTSSIFTVGGEAESVFRAFGGDISEVVIFTRILSSPEVSRVERYMGAYYGNSIP